MKLTRATAAECAAMADAHAQAFDDKSWREDEFEDLLEGEGIFGYLAEGADPQVASLGVILCRVAGGEMEVLTLGVTPPARRRGVARALLAVALPAGRDLGASAVYLEVAVDNEAAIALYERLGFRRAGLRKSYYDRRPEGFVDALVMRLDLDAPGAYPPAGGGI
jgi:ribosomal-protein-alanine N-acetyltransferase